MLVLISLLSSSVGSLGVEEECLLRAPGHDDNLIQKAVIIPTKRVILNEFEIEEIV